MQCAKAQLVANITTINTKIPFLNPQFCEFKRQFYLKQLQENHFETFLFKITKEKIRKLLNYGILLKGNGANCL